MKLAHLNGKKTYAFGSKEELISYLRNEKRILVAINTEKILNENERLKQIVNENIGYPDGIGAVFALKRKGLQAVKIRGAGLWLDIVRAFHKDKSFYLLGARDEVIQMTVKKLIHDFPAIRIVGYHNGYFDKAESEQITKEISREKPDVVFVAMGSPKQEYVMDDLISSHRALYMGLGGSFDLYCGKTKPVPEWWTRYFLWEGIYRVFDDFANLNRWKRQLPATRIIYRIILNKL